MTRSFSSSARRYFRVSGERPRAETVSFSEALCSAATTPTGHIAPTFVSVNLLTRSLALVKALGPAWVCFRVRYALRRKSGALRRRTPLGPWPEATAAAEGWFKPILGVGTGALAEAEAVRSGRYRLFSHHEVAVGLKPVWHTNPRTGQAAPADEHWASLGDFAFGDIKGIWELSRFPWAFALGRAYARTGDNAYAEIFWQLAEHWWTHNPPNRGPNWMCGQEATFRLMAALWAADVLATAAASTPLRRRRLAGFVVATGRRIAANLDYALSQSNNHGVSECVGLITAAQRVPSATEAGAWRRRGLAELRRQLDTLVYADGGFSQHSAVYHRVLLHDLLWLTVVLRQTEAIVPDWLTAAGQRALAYLDALVTPETGRVPLYGPNDGANVLPLADADHLDFRPVVQAGYAVWAGQRRFPPGPWDEAANWLAEPGWSALLVPNPQRERAHFTEAGNFLWRSQDLRVFLRCPTRFRHRPAQADLLHVDVEWRGQPIAHDAGTYSYNATGGMAGSLKEAAVHNSITFDGAEPLQKISRFLYLPWPMGQAGENETASEFAASHDGWRRLGLHHERRVSSWGDSGLRVTDRVQGSGRHRARLHWLLADGPHVWNAAAGRLVLQTPAGDYAISWQCAAGGAVASLVRADPHSARGWWSPYYDHAEPALSLAVEFEFADTAEITTTFAPA